MTPVLFWEIIAATALWLVACTTAAISYHRGGAAWVAKYGIPVAGPDGPSRKITGAIGDVVIVTLWLIGYVMISLACRDVAFVAMSTTAHAVLAVTVLTISVWCLYYPRTVLRKERNRAQHYLSELRRGYTVFPAYGIIFYSGVAVGIAKIILQFAHETRAFFAAKAQFLAEAQAEVAGASLLNLQVAANLERGFTDFNLLNRGVIQQLEPTVLLAVYMMIVIILVAQTPIRHCLHKDARTLGYYVTAVALAIVFLVAGTSYYFQYSSFSESYRGQLLLLSTLPVEDFDYLVRLSEMIDQVARFSGFSGFLRIFSEEGGLYVVAIAVAQFAVGALSRRAEGE